VGESEFPHPFRPKAIFCLICVKAGRARGNQTKQENRAKGEDETVARVCESRNEIPQRTQTTNTATLSRMEKRVCRLCDADSQNLFLFC